MVTGTILMLSAIAILLFSFIGLFDKKIGDLMKVIFFYLRNLQPNRKNFLKLPITVRKFYPVLRRRRGLLLRKLFIRYNRHRAKKKEEKSQLQKPAL